MKPKLILTCLLLLFAVTGCSSLTSSTLPADEVQAFLNNVMPPDFVGDVHVEHINPYFDFGIDATNVHKNAQGKWTWDSFSYNRSDAFHTKGTIRLSPRATTAAVTP